MITADSYIKYLFDEVHLCKPLLGQSWFFYNDYLSDAGLFSPLKKHHYLSWLRKGLEIIDKQLVNSSHENPILLDIGCGCGIFSLYAALNGYQVIACDLDPQSLLVFKCRSELACQYFNVDKFSVRFECCDARELNLPDSKIHLAISYFAFLMIPNPMPLLLSIVNSSRRFVIFTGNSSSFLFRFVRARSARRFNGELGLRELLKQLRNNSSAKVNISRLFITPFDVFLGPFTFILDLLPFSFLTSVSLDIQSTCEF